MAILERLGSKPQIAGLQISDSAVQCLRVGATMRSASVRLVPGVIREGKIQDAEKLLLALQELRLSLDPDRGEQIAPVVVSVPASLVYTQSFSVPNLGDDKLKEAAELNLQMISPLPAETAYMSWQKIGAFEDRFELLGAFAERVAIDQYRTLLEQARFFPVAFEFPGLSFSRLLGTILRPSDDPLIVFHISSDGINLSIVRNNALSFDYFRSWSSIQGENRTIPRSLFEEVVEQEVRKVVNFSLSRFQRTPQQIFLITPGLEQDMQAFLAGRFDIPIVPLVLSDWAVTSQWYVALGSALRGRMQRSRDRFVSVAPVSARELYHEEQTIGFIRIWRNVFVSVFAIFAVFYFGVAYFLEREAGALSQHLSLLQSGSYETELTALASRAQEFNSFIGTVQSGKESVRSWALLFSRLQTLGNAQGITIDRIEAGKLRERISLFAHAPSNEAVLAFRNALSGFSDFSSIDLPVSRITKEGDQSVSFVLFFVFNG